VALVTVDGLQGREDGILAHPSLAHRSGEAGERCVAVAFGDGSVDRWGRHPWHPDESRPPGFGDLGDGVVRLLRRRVPGVVADGAPRGWRDHVATFRTDVDAGGELSRKGSDVRAWALQVVVAALRLGGDAQGVRQRSQLGLEPFQREIAPMSRVHVDDEQPRGRPRGDGDVGVGPPLPPRPDRGLVRGCVLEAVIGERVLAGALAVRARMAGASVVTDRPAREDGPAASCVGQRTLECGWAHGDSSSPGDGTSPSVESPPAGRSGSAPRALSATSDLEAARVMDRSAPAQRRHLAWPPGIRHRSRT